METKSFFSSSPSREKKRKRRRRAFIRSHSITLQLHHWKTRFAFFPTLIMYFIRSTTIILLCLCLQTFIHGKSIHSSSSSQQIKDHIRQLLNLLGLENEYARFLSYLKIEPPKDIRLKELYDEYFSYNSYITDLVDFYAKFYTLNEITELTKFYSSPVGMKTIRFNHVLNQQMEDLMLTKISDYIFTAAEYGFTINVPAFH